MLDIIKTLFKSYNEDVPEIVHNELLAHFPNAVSIDWYPLNKMYEAVFYILDIEHIAKISNKGILLEYKKNLWLDEVPEIIKANSQNHGEIMSSIAIFSPDDIFYELILRDTKLVRNLLLFDKEGKLLKKTCISLNYL